ncbi:hypothetical protein [Staphylococcus arlettae]|uniref:hypothetical protein n=1 Tax=Staphylococcus arlettae TaxID=29378 RepID=UPI0002823954|nr:hypothetical protein [Staphylococcus arlettae]EJY96204.1 hypothetical protein SARL_03726 [Staphylococcus arlettae CVD059]
MNTNHTHISYPNSHTITLQNNEQTFYCTLRILEPHIINMKLTPTAPIELPTYTVTPFDTVLPYEAYPVIIPKTLASLTLRQN